MRIVSLLPSATEIICYLGLDAQLVGVTHECDYPRVVRGKTVVTASHLPLDADSAAIDRMVREQLQGGGSLYSLNREVLSGLRPDLIVTQTLCDVCAVAESVVLDVIRGLPGPPRVLNLEPTRLEHVLRNIQEVADAAGVGPRGREAVAALRRRMEAVRQGAGGREAGGDTGARHAGGRWGSGGRTRLAVLEWLEPLFSSGHWTPDLADLAGGDDVLAAPGQRSREVSAEELAEADPELILIACCGQSTQRALEDAGRVLRQPVLREMRAVREERVFVTDGSAYFSRPGPRLADSLDILANVIDPARHALPPGVPAAARWTSTGTKSCGRP
jgi:iron complex transport system substrate-binding protein